ncbi:MAG TPA: DUF58 domain-containing protein [Planctomycetota bacterium]|jgi:hypothetical protein
MQTGASRPGWFSRLLSLRPKVARGAGTAELAFPPDFLATLERLRLVALKAMGGGLREGHRLGAYKGGQLEFHGHRNYSPGDELRYIDWNVYARLGKPFVKEFAREEAGVLHLLLDATPSMSLGQPSKWTFARRVAALFTHVALASKDAAYLYVFGGGEPLKQFPHRGASGTTGQYLSFLEKSAVAVLQTPPPVPSLEGAGSTVSPFPSREGGRGVRSAGALGLAVSGFLRGNPVRGRVIVISDFWDEERDTVGAISRLASAGFEPAGIHVLAPEEIAPQADGPLRVRSMEEDAEVELSVGSDLAEKYGRELEKHRASIQEAFQRRGGNYLMASSDTSIERVLINTLRQRQWVS